MHNLKELKIWNKAIELATKVYKLTSNFPAKERYGLTSQIRKSAVPIPSNIAQGAGRNSNKEFFYFLGVSYELQTPLIISRNLNFLDEKVDLVLEGLDQR
jgi:four helix bundle protein